MKQTRRPVQILLTGNEHLLLRLAAAGSGLSMGRVAAHAVAEVYGEAAKWAAENSKIEAITTTHKDAEGEIVKTYTPATENSDETITYEFKKEQK
jgi:hypothetical protein